MMTTDRDGPSATDTATARDIAARNAKLLEEMEQLRQRLWALKGEHEHIKGLTILIGSVRNEREAAESFLASLGNSHLHASWRATHLRGDSQTAASRFRSSNVSAVERQWEIIKRCRHAVAIHQQLPKMRSVENNGQDESRGSKPEPRAKAVKDASLLYVHAIVEGGAEWLKIISKGEKKLLIEMAEGGWDWDVDEDEDEDEEDDALYEDIETLRTAKELVQTARQNWHNYHHPRIRIILTRVRPGESKEIDRLIGKLRRVGGEHITVNVHCADSAWVTNQPPIDLDTAISNLLPQDDDLTRTLVLDSSVLIALVSDVSHLTMEKQVWHDGDVQSQIDDERNGINFFPSVAYPFLRRKKLVCTKQAAEQFHKIARTMGSPTELDRVKLLLGGSPRDFQKYSVHMVPDDLFLPVQVLAEEDTTGLCVHDLIRDGVLPPVASEVQRCLAGIAGNLATHLYGWIAGLTVVTSNRALSRKIVRIVEASLDRDYKDGPRICTLPYNRALATNGPGPKKARKLAQQGLWPPSQQ